MIRKGSLYVINELLSKDMQHCEGTGNKARYINGEAIEYEYVATEEMKEDFLDAFQNEQRIDDFRYQIMNIVVEEAMNYFNDTAVLETAL